jgi:hypothetical protein
MCWSTKPLRQEVALLFGGLNLDDGTFLSNFVTQAKTYSLVLGQVTKLLGITLGDCKNAGAVVLVKGRADLTGQQGFPKLLKREGFFPHRFAHRHDLRLCRRVRDGGLAGGCEVDGETFRPIG